MTIRIQGAREHNLKNVDVDFKEGLTVVTGVSGSGKTSLVFDTLYHEARRRYLEVFSLGSLAGRLAPAHVDYIEGLGPAVAVGQNLLNRNPGSTLATASGLHPFLRLLFAHFGERACPDCGTSLVVYSPDEILERLASLSRHNTVSVSALLMRGVIGSHRTLLSALAEGFSSESLIVDGADWDGKLLTSTQPHDIEIRLRVLKGDQPATALRQVLDESAALGAHAITARWDGGEQTLSRASVCIRCGMWLGELRPVDFHAVCPHCQGAGCQECMQTGLPPQAAAVRWSGLRFSDFLALSVDQAWQKFEAADKYTPAARLYQEIQRRLEALRRVGLGYIQLNRASPSLSRGEAQRVRIAIVLVNRLEDMLHVLDEPTIGLHPADVKQLLPAFRDLAGPVVFVEHDRLAAAGADNAIDLGPGAGKQGGQVIFTGTPAELWEADTATGRAFSLRDHSLQVLLSYISKPPEQYLTVRGANLRNLQGIDVNFPMARLTVVTGVSGSGKSTLVEDVLVASLQKNRCVGCHAIEKPSPQAGSKNSGVKAVMVDQSPIGRNPRSNPATYTKLADILRDLFAEATGLSASHFSFNRPEGACPTCSGLGAVEVSMRYLPSTWIPCADCDGQRFSDEVLAARLDISGKYLSITDVLNLQVSQLFPLIQKHTHLSGNRRNAALRILAALEDIGLGYLPLGQPSPSLSGGEAQRVKLARFLGKRSLTEQVLVLDEPSTGLHPQDLAGLLTVLRRLVRSGATIIVVEHNLDVIRSADWVIDLGPGSGPGGGRLLYSGPPQGLQEAEGSLTGQALRQESQLQPGKPAGGAQVGRSDFIRVRGAHAHNLQDIDVDIPKRAFTVVTGLSGSGKSSLVGDVLETEARRRFLETLSLYERQGTHEGSEAEVEAISGLGVTLTIGPERLVYRRRATVGTATEISNHLAVLFSLSGERTCLICGGSMLRDETTNQSEGSWECPNCGASAPLARPRHFSASTYSAACQKCNGVGTLQEPDPGKLIIHPEKPLCSGAMYSPGFFPNGYLGKPYNHGYYQLQALGKRYAFDPHRTPWDQMTPEAQQAFLFGDPKPLMVTVHSRNGTVSTNQGKWPGFYGFIRDWDVGGTYTNSVSCPACLGKRLRPEYLAVTLSGYNIYDLSQMSLGQLRAVLDRIQLTDDHLARRSLQTAQQRLYFLIRVGLAYLHLDRVAGTLSAGEAQRIRLASMLGSDLTSLTLLLDEPTRGMHPVEVERLLEALKDLRSQGNTVIVVEHDPFVMRSADHLIDMGPGAGKSGGRIVAQGTPLQVMQSGTFTARWLRGEGQMQRLPGRRNFQRWLKIFGARANNLRGEHVSFPLDTLVGVCGVSGSGKSTLVMDTLGRVLAPKKQTTSVAYEPIDPGEYDRIEGAPARTLLIDQSRAGVVSPVGFLGLTQPLRAIFAESEYARAMGLDETQLAAGCSACKGSGILKLDMSFLPDVHVPCETCRGTGFLPEAWEVQVNGVSLPDAFGLTISQVLELYGAHEPLKRTLQSAIDVGLGYLVLRQPGHSLSGGEAQRLKIALELSRKTLPDTLYILDEPSVGQHLEDVKRLVGVLHRLVEEGGSVIVVEHHPHLLATCDWLVELGPGGGPEGGRIIASGTPEDLAAGDTPTAVYLREALEELI